MKVFICMPYGDHLSRPQRLCNVGEAMSAFHRLADLGLHPYCPHLSHFAHELTPRPREFWLRLSCEFLATCDCVVVIGEPTPGMQQEIFTARMAGKPVFHGRTRDESIQKLRDAYGMTELQKENGES